MAITPRRPRFFVYRSLYATALLLLMCTAWLLLAGTQIVRGVGDMARFGSILFQIMAFLQLSLVIFFSAMAAASRVAQEKDRHTLVLLLMTRLSNHELVLGKLLASLLHVLVMLAAGLPLLMLVMLLGGVSLGQVVRALMVTVAAALAAGSLGSTLALWREKTFQTLAMTALAIVFWLGICEAVAAGLGGDRIAGISCETWSTGLSPLRAILAATRSRIIADPALGPLGNPVYLFLAVALGLTAVLNSWAIARIRVWNPSREVHRTGPEPVAGEMGPSAVETGPRLEAGALSATAAGTSPVDAARQRSADRARSEHVDARRSTPAERAGSRQVWDNPILWREIRTRAYGRKILAIRIAYALLLVAVAGALVWSRPDPGGIGQFQQWRGIVPAAAKLLVPFFLVSLVIVNALAVTAITTERDGRCLDLLLVSDLSPGEFIFGILGGVFWVTKEMVLYPMLLACGLWWAGGIGWGNLVLVLGGLLVMDGFVATLGLHCGMAYANSRTAISVSLGTVFFLFLGVVTCILMMVSFSGSFEVQLAPFFAFILGGGVGLYVSLGARNPSAAIGVASLVVPLATFYAVVSCLLDHSGLTFLVTVAAYGFSIAAMLIPALHEFDFAMGRTTNEQE